MELKLNKVDYDLKVQESFNRTFMELKFKRFWYLYCL